MDTYDLTGLDRDTARDIVVQVVTSLKHTTAQRIAKEKDLEVWKQRVRLAAEKGRADLQAEAVTRVGDLEFEIDGIRAEETELERGVSRMKWQLGQLEREPALSVDAEVLLSQLDNLGGERDELADKFRKEEADAALEALKKSMSEEEKG